MRLIYGFFQHVFCVMKLAHDGSGLPTKITSALSLVVIYGGLVFINNMVADTVDFNLFFSISFVVIAYVFLLRNQLTGLIILIGIISNLVTLLLSVFGALTEAQLVLISIIEYLMVFGALTNVIKSHFKFH